MRSKGTAVVLLALLVIACGENEQKAAFDRYENAVNPLLTRDEELRARFGDELKDMDSFGDGSGVMDLVGKKMIPFYERMSDVVAGIRPEGEKLAGIHGDLVAYVTAWQDLLGTLRELGSLSEQQAAALDGPHEQAAVARAARKEKGLALNDAAKAAPEEARRIVSVFTQEEQLSQALFQEIQLLYEGREDPGRFLSFLDQQVSLFYARAKELVAAAEIGDELRAAAQAYLASSEPVIAAGRALAAARSSAAVELAPLNARIEAGYKEADRLRSKYLADASTYRDSLR